MLQIIVDILKFTLAAYCHLEMVCDGVIELMWFPKAIIEQSDVRTLGRQGIAQMLTLRYMRV